MPEPGDGQPPVVASRLRTALGALRLPEDGFARNNALSVFAMGALPAVAGSAVSVLLGMFMVWGIISVALGRFQLRLTASDRRIALAATVFVLTVLATALIAPEPPRDVFALLWLVPFLSLWVVIPRLRASPGLDYLALYCAGAAAGAVAAGLIALSLPVTRVAGGAGNAAVFAIMCLLITAFGALNIRSQDRFLRLLALAGVVGGLVAMALSLTRWVLLAAVPVALVLALYDPRLWLGVARSRIAWLVAAAAVLAIAWNHQPLLMRFDVLIEELGTLASDGPSGGSAGQRVLMWVAALSAIAESPFWGYGVQNRMAALHAHLPAFNVTLGDFSHAHNGILTFALDGGVIVLAGLAVMFATPILVALRAPHDPDHRQRLFLAILLSMIYVTVGMTHIMLKHDIMDAVFIFTMIVVAASIPDRGKPPA